jgi:hypothetical protein
LYLLAHSSLTAYACRYLGKLQDEELDMEALTLMSEDDFKEIGVPKGPRLKIMHRLRGN